MTRDYLREFDERTKYGDLTKEDSLLVPYTHPESRYELHVLKVRAFLKEALLASKEEGRAEAVDYIFKTISVADIPVSSLRRVMDILEAAKEEKV